MKEFFTMGGYGAYIWSAYAIAFIVLFLNWVIARRHQRNVINELRAQVQGEK